MNNYQQLHKTRHGHHSNSIPAPYSSTHLDTSHYYFRSRRSTRFNVLHRFAYVANNRLSSLSHPNIFLCFVFLLLLEHSSSFLSLLLRLYICFSSIFHLLLANSSSLCLSFGEVIMFLFYFLGSSPFSNSVANSLFFSL